MAYNNIIKTCVFVLSIHSMQSETTDSHVTTNTTTPPAYTFTNITFNNSKIDDDLDIVELIKNSRGRCGFEYEIIDVLARRSESQRQKLIKMGDLRYKKDIIKLLEHRFIGETYEAIVTLLTPHQELHVKELHYSISGLGTDEHAISEILGVMNRSEILNTSAIYEEEYNSTLKEDLIEDLSGSFKDLIIALCDTVRTENETVDYKAAKIDAKSLKAASKGKDSDACEKTFIDILTTRSFPQLRVIFDKFEKFNNKSILQAITDRFEGDLQYGLLIIAKNILLSKSEFYAGQLAEALSGTLYDDHQLTRIILGRSEIDLDDIKETYERIYGTQLVTEIAAKTNGAYNRLLLIILQK